MSYILNAPDRFVNDAIAGFVAAHSALVRRVPGGVTRRAPRPDTQVAVVIGGGSGHYPAFAGLVGPGMADAAAMGNVFASPSAQQVYDVARSVATSAGVLLSYGNYAGDVLNFNQAQDRLRAEGISCRTVVVTDDIFSAPPAEWSKRRGIAGDLVVFRAASWAAAQGYDLDRVHEIACRANERTRSVGVAFSGCTLPGADAPLFTVPRGRMAVGMGIHGEPGIEMRPLPTADELAILFVDSLLREAPEDAGRRVAVILNGLGAVKHEELFVVYAGVAERLAAAGLEIVDPEVGEFATSFEMAGTSLTLMWLDDELEAAWCAPAYSPAYRKGAVDLSDHLTDEAHGSLPEDEDEVSFVASESSLSAVAHVLAALRAVRGVVDREADELGRLDAVAGDGDHGIGMQRGAVAAVEAAESAAAAGAGAGSVLGLAGDAWAHRAGGTSGALWGAALRALGDHLGDEEALTAARVATGIVQARETVQALGKARVGDKTLVDALVPFAETLSQRTSEGAGLSEAWREAAMRATEAATATATLMPRLGRARPHARRSIGTPDPGAVSLALTVTAVGEALAAKAGA